MFPRNIAHPVIRQFILRTAVLNYLSKCLQQQWDDWRKLSRSILIFAEVGDLHQTQVQLIESLKSRVAASHWLLQREYDQLFTYMMDKHELWDSPEYFKAKTALGVAVQSLRLCSPSK
ncbi:hypothetical protein KR074_009723 [Drosophila pseudoananassae]|nr:hypothetical protein KR074_009723 [Drosophila pseudoananassae]